MTRWVKIQHILLLTDADASRRQINGTKRKTTQVTKYNDIWISTSPNHQDGLKSPKYHKFRPCHPDLFFAEVNLEKNTLKF